MTAYYNEIDPYAAAWLRNLVAAGRLVPGDVDERSIADVRGSDLAGYGQCHFFAGIGGWAYALALAGWPADRPVWTGSCPCQPLSSAGQRKGHADQRHLWPAFYELIAERRPATVFGEQVAGALGREWLAGIRADLEGAGYAVGAADLCAASLGAPHIRQRLFWVADARGAGGRRHGGAVSRPQAPGDREGREPRRVADQPGFDGRADGLADADRRGREGRERRGMAQPQGAAVRDSAGQGHRLRHPVCDRSDRRLAESTIAGRCAQPQRSDQLDGREAAEPRRLCGTERLGEGRATAEPGPSGGFWSDAELLPCLDGKARRAEPGIFPLADGLPGRVGKLRAAGNAIVPQVAAEFIAAFLETPEGLLA